MLNIQPGTLSRCHKYLDNMGAINQQSVQNLPQDVKKFLRQVTPARLKELAQMNCYAADKVKFEMDKAYGENNYIIIAIGRSMSSIAETLSKMGINTKIIPLSGLRRNDVSCVSEKDIYTYKDFLEKKCSLSKRSVNENKDKKYIIMDYAYHGHSIKRSEELLKDYDLLGNAPNLFSKTINEVLGDDFDKKKFNILFQCNRFKNYSYVGKLNVWNLRDVNRQCSPEVVKEYRGNITQGLRKLFWFNVFDSLQERNYNNIIPEKELNALYEH